MDVKENVTRCIYIYLSIYNSLEIPSMDNLIGNPKSKRRIFVTYYHNAITVQYIQVYLPRLLLLCGDENGKKKIKKTVCNYLYRYVYIIFRYRQIIPMLLYTTKYRELGDHTRKLLTRNHVQQKRTRHMQITRQLSLSFGLH